MAKFFKSKKGIIVLCSTALAVLLALAATFLTLHFQNKSVPTSAETSSEETVSLVESSEPEASSEEVSSSEPASEIGLVINSHRSTDTTTTEPFTVFRGTSDPEAELTLNGEPVERDEKGTFTLEKSLSVGPNTFTFSHKEKTYTYTVRYRYVVIKLFYPANGESFESGSSFATVANARVGSTVTAEFAGQTITLQPQISQSDEFDAAAQSETFIDYAGGFSLPSDNTEDLNMGKVKFTATCNGVTETGTSGNIICKKAKVPVVGEIVTFTAETFNGNSTDDASRPTNNYLPQGTVDYVVGKVYNNNKEYLVLRCGRRVYVSKTIGTGSSSTRVAVSREYAGTLPDTNQLSVASVEESDRFVTLTFGTAWKAPFLLDLLPQSYTNPAKQDYTVSGFTAQYVEIKFCYADALEGDLTLPEGNPLFSRSEMIRDADGIRVRLYLKRTGKFFGWDSSYNSAGQLVLKFLKPVAVTAGDNPYGVSLAGVKILVDVGHGGLDSGTGGLDPNYYEKERNLFLALKLKKELESTGATVVMTRTSDVSLDADTRCKILKSEWPDLCVSVHHDGISSPNPNGFGSFYSQVFSYDAAKHIYNETMNAFIYHSTGSSGNRNRLAWHYFFVARMSNCPVVLTENGFMTNRADHDGIISDEVNTRKAQAITRGVVKYFQSIQ